MIRAALLIAAILLPLQGTMPDVTGAISIFFAVSAALGMLEAFRRLRPAQGTNGDVVRVLKLLAERIESDDSDAVIALRALTDRIEAEGRAAESAYGALGDRLEGYREHDREVAELRHAQLMDKRSA